MSHLVRSLPHCWKSPPTAPICVCGKAEIDAGMIRVSASAKVQITELDSRPTQQRWENKVS